MEKITPSAAYLENFDKWSLIDEMITGKILDERVWKKRLHYPLIGEDDDKAKAVQKAFINSAQLLPATQKTALGAVGLVFRKDVDFEGLDPVNDYMLENADGAGNSLLQICKNIVMQNTSIGYGGVLVDVSDSGDNRAFISHYHAKSIPLVLTDEAGNVILVALMEEYDASDNWRTSDMKVQYRILQYDDNGDYIQTVEREDQPAELIEPTDYKGKRLKSIPFEFYGSLSNDYKIDTPPLYPMAKTNAIHCNNTACVQDAINNFPATVFLKLQDNVSIDKFTQSTGTVTLGSGKAYLGVESASVVQTKENKAAENALERGKTEMLEQGALLIRPNVSNISAETVMTQRSNETSILGLAASNVQDCLNKALNYASMFNSGSPKINEISFNTDLTWQKMTVEERHAWQEDYTASLVSKEEVRAAYKRGGMDISDESNGAVVDAE